MGKNFPRIYSLKEKPLLFQDTLQLIEKSFNYQAPYSFKTDFAPLVAEDNHHNCFILVDEEEKVLAHIGAKDRKIRINGHDHIITMLGGIAVDEKYRGKGYFQELFQDVLAEKRSDTAFFLLWSDQDGLYRKYGFHLCGQQYEVPHKPITINFKKTTYQQLNPDQQLQIKGLYENSFNANYLSLVRDENDWHYLSAINSCEIHIKEKNGEVTDYFMMGKGMDLAGVIHEYGSSRKLEEVIKEASGAGRVWTGFQFSENNESFYQFHLAPGDTKKFSTFVADYTDQKITIRDISIMKQEVYFDFNEETLALETEEFLRGIFGPGIFEELGEIKPLFLSGLDSI